jgi:protein TonB
VRPRLFCRRNLLAVGVSAIVHVAVLAALTGLHVQPPRIVSTTVMDVSLAGETAARHSPDTAAESPNVSDTPAESAAPTPDTAPVTGKDEHNDEGNQNAVADARYDVAALDNPKPPYPYLARRQRLEGTVLVRAWVLADGSCDKVTLSQSSGHEILDASVLDTVRRWRFLPARRAGQAIDAWVEIPVVFRLKK